MSTSTHINHFDDLNRVVDFGKFFTSISSFYVTLKKQVGRVISIFLVLIFLPISIPVLIFIWLLLKFKFNRLKNNLKKSLALSDVLDSPEHYKALIFVRDDMTPRLNDFKIIMSYESYPTMKKIPILNDVCNFVELVIEINNDLTEYLAKLDHKTANSKYLKFRSASELINERTNAYEYVI